MVLDHRNTWLGWQAVVLRMQYLNHCPLEPAERGVIVAHLAEEHPAPLGHAIMEWGALAAGLLAPPAGAFAFGVWRRRRAAVNSPP
jgi:hypothetical protein